MPYSSPVRIYLIDLHTYQDEAWLGTLIDGKIQLSDWGQVVAEEWIRASIRRKDFVLDVWCIQPSYVRGIVLLPEADALGIPLPGGGLGASEKPWVLSSFIASFKAAAAKRVNLLRNQPGLPVWQRGYREQRIPDAQTLDRLRQMIQPLPS